MKDNKYRTLALGLLFDALGMVSFFIPGVGEYGDVIWAPISAYLMTKLYKGKVGKAAAVFSFVEEALPFVDVVPTFTIMWFYTYVFNKESSKKDSSKDYIEVDPS
ncbi:hypothetical protein GCM10022393_26600 [Aquimarina addita]|uniref:Uncharacterized protein n=1 Tax=Aquimarina addita TaxID=870485 RepID=A0ABP6ULF8_9FLAO